MHDYYDDTLFGINYKKVDCIFDNPFDYTNDADLVLFPDMEYYVPFKTKKFINVKQPVCCVYYIDDLNTVTQQNLIDTPEEVSKMFAFKQTHDFAMVKTHKERYCYCGIGTL